MREHEQQAVGTPANEWKMLAEKVHLWYRALRPPFLTAAAVPVRKSILGSYPSSWTALAMSRGLESVKKARRDGFNGASLLNGLKRAARSHAAARAGPSGRENAGIDAPAAAAIASAIALTVRTSAPVRL